MLRATLLGAAGAVAAPAVLRRGYTDGHIRGILGGNFQRVLGQIWHV